MKTPPRGIEDGGLVLVPIASGQWRLVEQWLESPVAREFWYEGPESNMRWLRQIVERDTGEVLIVERRGEAIGLIVWEWSFPESDPEPAELLKLLEPGTCSYDVLIASAHYRNRGIGIKAARLLENRLWAIPDCRMLSAVSLSSNAVISRCALHMGYYCAGTAEEPGVGPVTMYLKRRPEEPS